jgi:arsenate reductase
MNALFKKSVAEFLGTAVFLTAIAGASTSGTPFKAMALALALGLMILILGPISGGHFNPAVSIYFYAKREYKFGTLVSYIVAQLAGAFAGVALGLALWGSNIATISNTNESSLPMVLGEILATAGLVVIIATLIKNKQTNLIWISVAAWVFAAANFTGTGAQANPAVTFGLLFAGAGTGTVTSIILAEIAGLFVAVLVLWVLDAKTAPAKKKPAKTEVIYTGNTVAASSAASAVKATTAAKPAAAKKPAAKKPAAAKPAAAKKPAAKNPAAK